MPAATTVVDAPIDGDGLLHFPHGFAWGTSTAAYQVEGATRDGGRGECIWDVFARIPGKVHNGDHAEVACDHFHRFKEDVQLMKRLGLQHYRLSLSWSRIIPGGVGAVNEEGIAFYNALIDELLANGIQPFVTILHFDLPMALQLEFDGWLGGEAVQDAFVEYARVCFARFGDRVTHWLTINEPWILALLGHGWGVAPPGRRHNAGTEPYIVAHNVLLAHAKAVAMYRNEFEPTQHGKIGLPLVSDWRQPKPTEDAQAFQRNQEAAQRARQYVISWFADPLYFGDYPEIMRQRAGDRLPHFTDDEKKLLKGSADFMALNHYSTRYAEPSEAFLKGETAPAGRESVMFDEGTVISEGAHWAKTDMDWSVVPEGFGEMLEWVHTRYAPPGGIYVTENGCAYAGKDRADGIDDQFRVDFYKGYITAMHGAIQRGVDVRGFFAWSTMDNFEWSEGYNMRMGLVWVDFDTQERTPKKSARFFSEVARKNAVSA